MIAFPEIEKLSDLLPFIEAKLDDDWSLEVASEATEPAPHRDSLALNPVSGDGTDQGGS